MALHTKPIHVQPVPRMSLTLAATIGNDRDREGAAPITQTQMV
jgi:hypothetical protein